MSFIPLNLLTLCLVITGDKLACEDTKTYNKPVLIQESAISYAEPKKYKNAIFYAANRIKSVDNNSLSDVCILHLDRNIYIGLNETRTVYAKGNCLDILNTFKKKVKRG